MNEPLQYQFTPLHCACSRSASADIIAYLLDSGADPELRNRVGHPISKLYWFGSSPNKHQQNGMTAAALEKRVAVRNLLNNAIASRRGTNNEATRTSSGATSENRRIHELVKSKDWEACRRAIPSASLTEINYVNEVRYSIRIEIQYNKTNVATGMDKNTPSHGLHL